MNNQLMLIIPVVLVFVLAGAGYFFFFSGDGNGTPAPQTVTTAKPTSTASIHASGTLQDGLAQKIGASSIWKSKDSGAAFLPSATTEAGKSIDNADIVSIAFHPVKAGRIVVGTVDDGIYATESGGDSWTPIPFPPQKIYSFILDKGKPDTRMFASGVLNNYGKVFRTDDGGRNWKVVYTEPGQKTAVTALAQHPMNRNIIFAATSEGTVAKSTDGGDTWKNVGSVIRGTVSDIAFDAARANAVYLLSLGKRMYYSPDGGLTWLDWEEEKEKEVAALEKQASLLLKEKKKEQAAVVRKQAAELEERNKLNRMPAGIVSLLADPLQTGVIYAGTKAGLYRSTSFGKYWTALNIIESASEFPIHSIAVHPKNAREVVFVSGKTFYRSLNAGETWAMTSLDSSRDATFVVYDPLKPTTLLIGVSKLK